MARPASTDSLNDWARGDVAERRARDLYRRRRVVDARPGTAPRELVVDGKRCVEFCSNDYLGLRDHPRVVEALRKAAAIYGAGSGSAHLISGHCREHHALEEELADFLQRPRALLFSTGYMANLGVVPALLGRGDLVLEDRLNHASLLDAGRLSGARLARFAHADPGALEARLQRFPARRCMVATDGVFSMDGDLAPLTDMAERCGAHGAWLMVDDAHGIGVIGPGGRGSLEHFGLGTDAVPVLMGTLGKALGTFGAFVAGESELIDSLVQRARTYIYTTAPPPAVAAASRAALAMVREGPDLRLGLRANVARFRQAAEAAGLPLGTSATPIQPLLVGAAGRAVQISEALFREGIWVSAIRPPTVPAGSARLRITLSAGHRPEQIDRLVEALARLWRQGSAR